MAHDAGVYDGHKGAAASTLASSQIPILVSKAVENKREVLLKS